MRLLSFIVGLLVVVACGESAFLSQANAETHNTASAGSAQFNFKKVSVRGIIEWQQGPLTCDFSSFIVRFVDVATGQPVELAQAFKVELWMPSMGHGSSPVTISPVPNSSAGTYLVEKVAFIMPGDWDIRFRLVSSGQVVDAAVISLKL